MKTGGPGEKPAEASMDWKPNVKTIVRNLYDFIDTKEGQKRPQLCLKA